MFQSPQPPDPRLGRILVFLALAGLILPGIWWVPQFERPPFPQSAVPAKLYAFDDCGPWERILKRSGGRLYHYRFKIEGPCQVVDRRDFFRYTANGQIALFLEPK